MFRCILTGLIVFGAGFVYGPGSSWATPTQRIDNTAKICAEQTQFQEREHSIPAHLLTAISHTESGRWNATKGAIVAWPWTVTSGGKGRFFDSKEEAMAEVEFLMTDGVRNIDVGCMQINLHYHGQAFETLSLAFDPKVNTAYAATFLIKLKKPSNSWMDAAGTYHSSTPDKKAYYQKKVLNYWNTERGISVATNSATTTKPLSNPGRKAAVTSVPTKSIDYARMAQLNKTFKSRQQLPLLPDRELTKSQRLSNIRQSELLEWRSASARGKNIANLLAKRRAQQLQRQRKKFAGAGKSTFSEKRRNQLEKWRLKGIWSGS